MDRQIAHMDLDTFFVSVERLKNSAFIGKPLIIGGISDRGVVASCSYETRLFGVRSAMPMKMARQLCPDAIVIRGDSESYSHFSNEVTEIIAESVPLYEKSSIDEFYIDLTGTDRFFGSWQIAKNLKQKIMENTGLPISFGLSPCKTVSKIATGESKPVGQKQILAGTEKTFLGPLGIQKIPGVGGETYKTLRTLGIKLIKTVQEMPMELMEHTLGKYGKEIWKKANGIDNSAVEPWHERKSISTERTFERDTIDAAKLENLLATMAENLAYQLRKDNKLTACVTVKVRYSDFNTHTMQLKIPYTSADHVLISRVRELFRKLYNRRLLVRLVGLRCSDLVSGGQQMNMFEDTEEMANLYQAMDRIRLRYGDAAVRRAIGMEIDNSRQRMNPFNGLIPAASGNGQIH